MTDSLKMVLPQARLLEVTDYWYQLAATECPCATHVTHVMQGADRRFPGRAYYIGVALRS